MSHWAKVQNIEIKDVAALREALRQMGLTLEAGREAQAYSARKFDYAVRLKGGVDVGFARENDHLVPHADFWYRCVESELGRGLVRLKNEYAAAKLTLDAHRRGQRVTRQVVGDKIVLQVTY